MANGPTNPYCEALGIEVPDLTLVGKGARDVSTYGFLLVALLEKGSPLTLAEVAERFEAAGLAHAEDALRSLKRCRPATPPIYRDGEHYALGPHDDEAALWTVRLGLRQPTAPTTAVEPPNLPPLPGEHAPLAVAHLDELWKHGTRGWSAQRLVLCALDANARAMPPAEVLRFISERWEHHGVTVAAERHFRRKGSAVRVTDGHWAPEPGHRALRSARRAVRNALEVTRRSTSQQSDPAVVEARIADAAKKRDAHAMELAKLRRVLVHAYPAKQPEFVVLVDVNRRELETYVGKDALGQAASRLQEFDLIGAIDVRPLLRSLGANENMWRLTELGPPQKTRKLNKSGRTLKITTDLLVSGSTGISRPFGDEKKKADYLRLGDTEKLRRRLESDAKHLLAYYEYGRLHGAVRLRWGFLDEMIRVSWAHWDEPRFYSLVQTAEETGGAVEAVVGTAPGFSNPWARAKRLSAEPSVGYRPLLVTDDGLVVRSEEVQLARLVRPESTGATPTVQ